MQLGITIQYVGLSLLMSYNLGFSQDSVLVHNVKTIIQSKEYHTAISMLDNYIKNNKDINKKFLGDLYSACGYCFQMINNDTASINYYRKAIDYATTVPYVYHQMAKYHSKGGNIDEALSLANKCVTLKPDYVQTWLLITDIYKMLNDSLQWLSSCRRTAHLGDKDCQKLLGNIDYNINWDISQIQSEMSNSEPPESFYVDDTLGFWGTSGITNFYSIDPPEFVPVEDQPIPIISTKTLYKGIQDFENDTTTIAHLDTIIRSIPTVTLGFPPPPNDSIDIVWVKILVSESGFVKKSFAFISSNSFFNNYACNKLKLWKFNPAMLDKKCYAVWAVVPIKIVNR
jgi:tetratricopeptide (TPR) repeat protein